MSIRTRILIPMVVVAVLVATAILVSNTLLFSRFVNESIYNEMERSIMAINDDIEKMELKTRIASLNFANDPAIAKGIKEENRQALMSRASQMCKEAGVELCAVADMSGKVLIRVNAPEVYGDDITVMYSIESALAGIPSTTIDYGVNMDMVVCSGVPIHSEKDDLLGLVIVGFRLDTEGFVDKQKMTDRCEVSVYREDTLIATTLLNKDGTRATGIKAPAFISQEVLSGNIYRSQARISNVDMLTLYSPISNADGEVIGMLFAAHHLSDRTNAVRSFITSGVIITVMLLGISILVIFNIVHYVSTPITEMLDKIHYDGLTGIYNRRYFDENLDRLLKSVSRSNGSLSLMMIDIDFFKYYNDTYGHSKGDECLKIIAKTLKQGATRADDFVARYGGEEFAVVLPNTKEIGAVNVANRLLEAIRNCKIPHESSPIADHVTISIGVTTGAANFMQSVEEYINRADEMLYKSKHEGRNRYNFSDL